MNSKLQKTREKSLTTAAVDILGAAILLTLVWGAFSLIDIHDSVMTEDDSGPMVAQWLKVSPFKPATRTDLS